MKGEQKVEPGEIPKARDLTGMGKEGLRPAWLRLRRFQLPGQQGGSRKWPHW